MFSYTLLQLYSLATEEGKLMLRLRIVEVYRECGSLRETARRLSISRNTVRKWVRRYGEEGEAGLLDRSRRPKRSPRKTPKEVEDQVLKLREERGWGRRRIAHALGLAEGTVRHILRRNLPEGERRKRRKRKVFYPARWTWEEEEPFRLAQVDTKDILDKGTLGTALWDHIRKHHLPRYQWTFLEGRTRFRFLAYSHELSLVNGLCFVALVMSWLRAWGIGVEVQWQEDWGSEFGGENPHHLAKLGEKYYRPFRARLCRAPKGRKGYQGRVERSHRTDDEEFLIPYVGKVETPEEFLRLAQWWQWYYNVERPHFGVEMEGKSPMAKLRKLGLELPDEFAAFPVVILDELAVIWASKGGHDVLAHYTSRVVYRLTTQ
ncbi:helix-turn-helix domain-containing protein [Candidatus Bipolaricaulota sp. J31]